MGHFYKRLLHFLTMAYTACLRTVVIAVLLANQPGIRSKTYLIKTEESKEQDYNQINTTRSGIPILGETIKATTTSAYGIVTNRRVMTLGKPPLLAIPTGIGDVFILGPVNSPGERSIWAGIVEGMSDCTGTGI